MERFATAGHLRSWAGLCPRLDESAGKKRNARIRKGAPWLKTTLVQAAWSAVRVKNSYYKSLYGSVKRASGSANKAIVAVAAAMLTAAYYMLKRGEPYKELGPEYRDRAVRIAAVGDLRRDVGSQALMGNARGSMRLVVCLCCARNAVSIRCCPDCDGESHHPRQWLRGL